MVGSSYRVSIVLPAYNEEANIEAAVRRATAAGGRLCSDHEVIVVDDGSHDGTARVVRSLADEDPRVRLVAHGRNCGYGEALRTGFRAATMDLVFFTDADNQFDLDELESFLPWSDHVDVVAGYRVDRCDPWFRRLNGLGWNFLVPPRCSTFPSETSTALSSYSAARCSKGSIWRASGPWSTPSSWSSSGVRVIA